MSQQLGIYLIFLLLVPVINMILPGKLRIPFLLAASWFFYAVIQWQALPVLIAVSIVCWYCAIKIEKQTESKKLWLALALGILLGSLVILKLIGFFGSSYSISGFSFYSLAAAGYVFDVYKAKCSAEKNYLRAALFVSFYPVILSGPIERSTGLLSQIQNPGKITFKDREAGITRILWGAFKKIVIADQLAVITNTAFRSYESFTGIK